RGDVDDRGLKINLGREHVDFRLGDVDRRGRDLDAAAFRMVGSLVVPALRPLVALFLVVCPGSLVAARRRGAVAIVAGPPPAYVLAPEAAHGVAEGRADRGRTEVLDRGVVGFGVAVGAALSVTAAADVDRSSATAAASDGASAPGAGVEMAAGAGLGVGAGRGVRVHINVHIGVSAVVRGPGRWTMVTTSAAAAAAAGRGRAMAAAVAREGRAGGDQERGSSNCGKGMYRHGTDSFN